ncbi:MAG TPA: hypothetical protein VNE61_04030 [Ktedonobacteraceae bacterium]|nr:hypothetical protein [Ktedonobacteraceae bacterium]
MRLSLRKKPVFTIILLLSFIILLWGSLLAWFVSNGDTFVPSQVSGGAPSHSYSPETTIARPKTITPTPTIKLKRPNFETGMVFPQWQQNAYSTSSWHTGLQQIQTQTGARWVEMPLLFDQPSSNSTDIAAGNTTPTVASFASGIQAAHAQGFHVFIIPLVSPWSGTIEFTTYAEEQQWFSNYWQAYQPYIQAAAQNGVEQLAIGTEDDWLQENAPSSLWNQLIANVHSIYTGTITYDMNWIQQLIQLPSWMKNPDLKMIGFSEYIPLVSTPTPVDPGAIRALWSEKVKPIIDGVAAQLGKPIIISEIGYRGTSDALYQPYQTFTSAPADPELQAAAFDAAIADTISDPSIEGIYAYAWDNVLTFTLKTQPSALSVLHKWYTSPEA